MGFRDKYVVALEDRTLKVLLNVREPKQVTLEAAIKEAWSSRVVQWKEG